MRKIKKGDKVQVISGKMKGTVSEVEKVIDEGTKVVVQGVNVMKKAVKGQGYQDKTMPIDYSNVLLYCPKCKKGVKVARIENSKGMKVRQCKVCLTEL
ncbi:MAG: 50S ribosomal protein L24 [Candidatus Absconditabacteria bacterium]